MIKRTFVWFGKFKPATLSKVMAVGIIGVLAVAFVLPQENTGNAASGRAMISGVRGYASEQPGNTTGGDYGTASNSTVNTANVQNIQCDSSGNVPENTVKSYLGSLISASVSSGGVGIVTNNTNCTLPVSLASYGMYDNKLATQRIFDSTGVSLVASGRSKNLTVGLPNCMAQIDLYYGAAPQQLDNANSAGPRTLAWNFYRNNGTGLQDARGQFCGQPTPPPPPPAQPQLVCTPSIQTVKINENITVTATGGNGSYEWFTSGGNPSLRAGGNSFTTKYAEAGAKSIKLTSGNQSVFCFVNIATPPTTTAITIAKSGPSTVNRGQEFSYQLVVTNTGNLEAKDIIITDEVMIPLTYLRAGGASCEQKTSARTPRGSVQCAIGNLAKGQSKTVTLTFKVDSGAGCQSVIHNKAEATLANGNKAASNEVLTTVNCPSVQLVCTPNSQTVNLGHYANFAATGGTGTYVWSAVGGDPTAGSNPTFATKYSIAGSKTVTVKSGEQTVACAVNVIAPIVPPINLRLSIDKQVRNITHNGNFAESITALRGEIVEFKIVLKNIGNAEMAGVILSDTLSNNSMLSGFTNLIVSGSGYWGELYNGGLSIANLKIGQDVTVTYRYTVMANAPVGGICNTATAKATGAAQVQDNACVTVAQVQGGNVSLSFSKKAFNDTKNKEATTSIASREDFITYTLTVSNSGNLEATNLVITDDLSGVLPLADMVDAGGGTVTNSTITYPGVTVPAGGTVSKQFRVRVKYGLASNVSYVMKNTYGNTVNVTINNPVTYVAPKTGASTGPIAAIGFAGLLTAVFALHQKKNIFKAIFS